MSILSLGLLGHCKMNNFFEKYTLFWLLYLHPLNFKFFIFNFILQTSKTIVAQFFLPIQGVRQNVVEYTKMVDG